MANFILIQDADLDSFSGGLIACSAFTQKFAQLFEIKHIPLVMDDDWKGALRKSYNIQDHVESKLPDPYAYIKVSNLGVRQNSHNAKTIARSGSGYKVSGEATGDLSNASVEKTYHYWGDVAIELCVGFRDFQKFFAFCEKLSIAIAAGRFACSVNMNGGQWVINVDQSASSIPIQPTTKDDPSNPAWFMLSHQLTLWTQFGVSVKVPKLNNEGVIQTNVGIQGP